MPLYESTTALLEIVFCMFACSDVNRAENYLIEQKRRNQAKTKKNEIGRKRNE